MDPLASPAEPPAGLSLAEVAAKTAAGQVNRARRSDPAEYADIVARNVFTLFNALVVPAAAALLILRDWKAGATVSGMAAANTLLGLAQEVRAKRCLDRLTLLAEARVRVLRAGRVCEVPSGDVVQGDHLLLAAGDPVVADGEVVEARSLEVDEALLTGESDPVPRRAGELLLSGSFCVAGEGAYRADRVGASAYALQTAAEARSYRPSSSPLQRAIDRLVGALSALAVLMCLCYVGLWQWHGNIGPDQLARMVGATITAMIPAGLVVMTTLAFVLGAARLSAHHAVVNRLESVEVMASIDTLCMDKTGTLTTNRLTLAQVRVVTAAVPAAEVQRRLRLFAGCSPDQGSKTLAALRAGLGAEEGALVDQIPFKSQNRFSAVRVRSAGQEQVLVLGACEALAPLVQGEASWQPAWKELLPGGLRLLLFAEGTGPTRGAFHGSLAGFALRPLALLALSDELRPEAKGVLRRLARQGIAFKILSGDNPETVRAAVAPLVEGAPEPALRALAAAAVVSGAELEASADPGALIQARAVFGRVSPWQKVEIVRTLKGQGRRVAMVGDGVNDVLPIKNANLGVAMGEGSRAAKTVAGIVLGSNDFGLLPRALDEGRTILRNIRRAASLFLVKNVYTFLLVVAALGAFDLPFPFVPQQVTLLNFLTIGLPALLIMLGREPAPCAGENDVRAARPDFVRQVGWFAVRTGVLTAAAALAVQLASARVLGDGPAGQRSMLLAALVLLGAVTLWRALADGERGLLRGDRLLRRLPAATVPGFLLAMYAPPAAAFFELTPLDAARWAWVAGAAAVGAALMWLSDRRKRYR
jgi:magnesium-transporting ATPase (P-type)